MKSEDEQRLVKKFGLDVFEKSGVRSKWPYSFALNVILKYIEAREAEVKAVVNPITVVTVKSSTRMNIQNQASGSGKRVK